MGESLRRALEQIYEGESRLSRLTRRQLEVLALMAKGYNNASIARALVLEEKSVENHINAIFGQLRVNRDGAVHRRVKAVLLYLQDVARASEDTGDEAKAA